MNDDAPDLQGSSSSGEASLQPDAGREPAAAKKRRSKISAKAATAALEARMNEKGYLDAQDMATSFNMLRANHLIWSFVVGNYLLGKEPVPFDLLYWNSDATRMPAAMHSFYLRNMY